MPNKLTTDAGLATNVNSFRTSMVAYCKSQDMYTIHTNEEGEAVRKLPQIAGGQVALTAAVECQAMVILKATFKKTIKDKSGLRTANRGIMGEAIAGDIHLNSYYNWKIRSFNEEQMYEEMLPISKADLNSMISNVNNKFTLTPKARNMWAYLVSEFYTNILNTAFQFMSHAGKKSLKGDTIVYAIRNRTTSALASELVTEVNRAMAAVGDDVAAVANNEEGDQREQNSDNEGDSDGQEDNSDASEEDDDDAPAKNKKGAKKTPPTKANNGKGKKAAQIEQSDESDNNDDAEGSDNEPTPTKAKGKATKSKNAKGKNAKGKTSNASK